MTNQCLINVQHLIIDEVLPLQDASRSIVLTMGAFGQRHADLLATDDTQALADITPRSALEERYAQARERLADIEETGAAGQLSALDNHFQALLTGDAALEGVRRDAMR